MCYYFGLNVWADVVVQVLSTVAGVAKRVTLDLLTEMCEIQPDGLS